MKQRDVYLGGINGTWDVQKGYIITRYRVGKDQRLNYQINGITTPQFSYFLLLHCIFVSVNILLSNECRVASHDFQSTFQYYFEQFGENKI